MRTVQGLTALLLVSVTALPAYALNLLGDAEGDGDVDMLDAVLVQSGLYGQSPPSLISPLALTNGDTTLGLAEMMQVSQAAFGFTVLTQPAGWVVLPVPAPLAATSGDAPIALHWPVNAPSTGAQRTDGLETAIYPSPSTAESVLSNALPLVAGGGVDVQLTPVNTTGASQVQTYTLTLDVYDSQGYNLVATLMQVLDVTVGPSVCANGWPQPGEACDDGEADECAGICNGDCTGPAYLHCGLCPEGQVRVGASCETVGAIFHYSDDVNNGLNPFPDDRYRDGLGAIALPDWNFLEFQDPEPFINSDFFAFAQTIAAQTSLYTSGFGTYSPLEFSLSAAINTATLPAGMHVVNLDTMTPWTYTWTATWYSDIGRLDLQPELPLDSLATYGVILTSDVKTPLGTPLGYDHDFRNLLGGNPAGDMGALIAYATGTLGLARDEIAGAYTFTTEATWQDLWTVRSRLDSGNLPTPAPSFAANGATPYTEGIFNTPSATKNSLLGTASPYYKTAAVGNVNLHNFRGADLVWNPAYIASGGAPPTERVRFHMAIPNVTAPVGGYPAVIIGHGLGGSANFAWEIARIADNYVPTPNFVLIAHDHTHHGYRGTGNSTTDLFNYFNFANFYAMRDNFRTTAGDILQMRRIVRQAALALTPPFNQINPNKIYYLGSSLGGINGATFMAVDSQVTAGVLNVPACELVKILQSPTFSVELLPALQAAFGIMPGDPAYDQFFRILINRGLWIMGPGDPANYAPFMRPGWQLPGSSYKGVLIQLGVGDTLLPNDTTRTLARLMGVPTLTGESQCFTPGCLVSGMWEFDPVLYGFLTEEPHEIARFIPQAQAQIIRYAESEGSWILDGGP